MKPKVHGDLIQFIDLLRQFQYQDMDMIIPISSRKGMGKTTDALQVARLFLNKYHGWSDSKFKFGLKKLIAYDNAQVFERIEEAEDSMPIICDEAVRFAMAEDWNKAESREMKKKFAQIRTKHLILLMCIPNFWWLDRKYREDMCLFWMHNITRGFAMIYTPAQNIGIDDVWYRKSFFDVKQKFNIFTDPLEMKKVYDKHPCYFGYVTVKQCNPDIYAEYKKLRDAAVWDRQLPTTPQKYMLKSLVYNLYTKMNNGGLKPDTKLTYEELARTFLHDPIKGRPFYDDTSGRDMVGTWIRELKSRLGENNNTDTE